MSTYEVEAVLKDRCIILGNAKTKRSWTGVRSVPSFASAVYGPTERLIAINATTKYMLSNRSSFRCLLKSG